MNAGAVTAALITALATIAAAFIGGAFAGPRIGLVVAQPTVTITPRPTATAQATPGGTQTSPGTVLFQKKGVQLTQSYQLIFTDPALRPSLSSCSGDLYVCSSNSFVGSSAQLTVIDGQAGFSECEADTAYVAPGGYANDNGQSLVGKTLCVTTGHRIAACHVTADTTQASIPVPTLTMDVTVYALK
jgi:hypothetical protein